MKQFLQINKMLTTSIIQGLYAVISILFVVLIVLQIVFGIIGTVVILITDGAAAAGAVIGTTIGGIILYCVLWLVFRIWCEFLIVIFKIHDNLETLVKK